MGRPKQYAQTHRGRGPEYREYRALDDASAGAAIREKQIDILINLNGYFGEHRTRLFAHRPAPVQVNYLGFPVTLGAPYMDYLIADQHVIPLDERAYYSEKIVYLPDCYQPNDRHREIAARVFSRSECGCLNKASSSAALIITTR